MSEQAAVALANAFGDRYRLERELGRGGMATVWLAHDGKHDRLVAMKVLRSELSALVGPERFQREIQLAAPLKHPHILPLHDSEPAITTLGAYQAARGPALRYMVHYWSGLAPLRGYPLLEALLASTVQR